MKESSCNNSDGRSEREIQITRIELLKNHEIPGPECWVPLDINSNYLVSSKGRMKHLKSYNGQCRVLCPSVKFGKYLYYTITSGSKRRGIALISIFKRHFQD